MQFDNIIPYGTSEVFSINIKGKEKLGAMDLDEARVHRFSGAVETHELAGKDEMHP